jgi:hypothetical protein
MFAIAFDLTVAEVERRHQRSVPAAYIWKLAAYLANMGSCRGLIVA